MKLAFLGTPDFAVPSLTKLLEAGHDIQIVLTQPDRPSGRGQRVRPCAVKQAAVRLGLPILQPRSLDAEVPATLRSLDLEALVVVAYGLILPPALLRLPPRGCINLHASLLPRYRGAAPVVHAILKGETKTGVTTLLMDEGIDTGPILLQRETAIGAEETAGEVEARLSLLGSELLVETLEALLEGRVQPRPQVIDYESFAPKIRPEMATIRWEEEGVPLVNLVRAMNPRPGASTSLGRRRLKIWRAAASSSRTSAERDFAPGTVLSWEGGLRVACGRGTSLLIREIQVEGRRRISGEEAVRGRWFRPGERFGDAATAKSEGTGSAPTCL